MSYDLYCYKSKIGVPDEEEADSVIEADTDKWGKKELNPGRKLAIIKALKKYNPKLIAIDFTYGEVTDLTPEILAAEKRKFDHIEINAPEGEISVRLTVYDNHVMITVPYWYKGDQAKQLFQDIKSYIEIIYDTAGYFVFDSQTGEALDPSTNSFDGRLDKYLSVSE